ncbi:MAG: hypothetical protein P9L96_00585 [Candidatus Gygaella obscura]|nr:hypothetical protein [Candidatus Gygaella obscura]
MTESILALPVRFKGNYIEVLDETLLPFNEKYIRVDTLEYALSVLGSMKTRAMGQVLLFFYSCVLFEKNNSIDEIAGKFKDIRPTFDFILLADLVKKALAKEKSIKSAVESFINGFQDARHKRAKSLASILPDDARVLTICNVNSELIYLAEEMHKLNKKIFFYVCETRPYLQGTRLTFWELRKRGISCKLICISQSASLMQEGSISTVITGADRSSTRGAVINKIGTYSLAILAKHFNIAFYPLVQYAKDIDIDAIKIEERAKSEVFMFLKGDFAHMDALYPAFDVVEKELITKNIDLTKLN